jgi:hypothetical protein
MTSVPVLRKLAQPQGGAAQSPDQQFEQGFFQLAYDKLQSRLFNLLPHLVGFEVVQKEPDGTRAVGVFGFRSDNGHVLFVPAFFVNGAVRELDMLYSKNNQQFYPLNEDFAQLFLRDDPTGMGRVSDETRQALEMQRPSPDTRDMSFPPAYGRTVYAEAVSLPDFVRHGGEQMKRAMAGLLRTSPAFTEAVLRFHTPEKLASALVPEKSGPRHPPAIEVFSVKAAPKDLKVKAVRDGYVAVDRRTDAQKSRFGEVQAQTRFFSPDGPGFYTYLTETGETRRGIVLVPQELTSPFNHGCALVLDLQSGAPPIVHRTESLSDVVVAAKHEVKGFAQVHARLQNPADVKPDYETWLLVNPHLESAGPFEIELNYLDSKRIRRLVIRRPYCCGEDLGSEVCHSTDQAARRWPKANLYEPKCDDRFKQTLVFSKEEDGPLRRSGRLVVVPKGWKLLKVNPVGTHPVVATGNDPSDGRNEADIVREREEHQRRVSGRPGRKAHLTSLMHQQKLAAFSLRRDDAGLIAFSAGESRRYDGPLQAKIGMLLDYGFDDEDARRLVDQAVRNGRVEGCIKRAVTGDYVGVMRDEPPSYNELGQPTTYGIPYQELVPFDPSYSGDPTARGLAVTDPNAASQQMMPSQHELQQAVGLARAGQKEIFDTGAIALLSKYVNPAGKVFEYLPAFSDTLDKLGRMLFMLNWDMDKFQKMYGPDELPELQELLTNVFKNLGDLIIFLKRKFPDISINRSDQAVGAP